MNDIRCNGSMYVLEDKMDMNNANMSKMIPIYHLLFVILSNENGFKL